MKKIMLIGLIIFLFVFFTMPAFIFADTGDDYTASNSTPDGQYGVDSDDANSDLDVDVYCIDDETFLTTESEAYKETGEYVSDVLQEIGGNGTGPVSADNAEAVEIMATTATGATNSENQDVVWDLIEGDGHTLTPDGEIVKASVLALAEEYNDLDNPEKIDDPANPGTEIDNPNFITLQEFLDSKNVNEVVVTLDSDPLINDDPFDLVDDGDYNEFTAEVVMADPLAPSVTDYNKTVFWAILEGSFNVSFEKHNLVTEKTSIMIDIDADDDDSGADVDTLDDNYGYSSIPYYFYWWGAGFPEYEGMNVVMSACVDIDSDAKIDKSEADANEFVDNVVQTVRNPGYDGGECPGPYNSPNMVAKDPITQEVIVGNPTLVTLDICENEGGKVLQANTPVEVYERGSNVTFTMPRFVDEGWGPHYVEWVSINGGDWQYYNGNRSYFDNRVNRPYQRTEWIPYGPGSVQFNYTNYTETSETKCAWRSGGNWHYEYDHTYNTNSAHVCVTPAFPEPQFIRWDVKTQRFTIENYSEPCAIDQQMYCGKGDLTIYKTDSETGLPVNDAIYKLTYMGGQTLAPALEKQVYYATTGTGFGDNSNCCGRPAFISDFILYESLEKLVLQEAIVNPDGYATFNCLLWGLWQLTEFDAPDGYAIDINPYNIFIGGLNPHADSPLAALYKEYKVEDPSINESIAVSNDPLDEDTPPETPKTPTTPVAGIIEVAGITGIDVLAFTGVNPALPIGGIGTIIGGLSLFIVSLVRKRNK